MVRILLVSDGYLFMFQFNINELNSMSIIFNLYKFKTFFLVIIAEFYFDVSIT